MLTFRPPFPGNHRDQVIGQILHKEPCPPRRLNRRVPLDLQTICLKAMDKDPDQRYQSAAGLAEDLRRYANGFTITAKRPGVTQRVRKLVNRNRTVVMAFVASFLLLVTAVLVVRDYYIDQAVEIEQLHERLKQVEEEWIPEGHFDKAYALLSQVMKTSPNNEKALALIIRFGA